MIKDGFTELHPAGERKPQLERGAESKRFTELRFTGERKPATVVAKYVLGMLADGITDRAARKARWERCLETLRKSVPVVSSDSGDLPQWNLDSDNGVLVVRATREQQDVFGALIGDMKSRPSPASPKP